MPGSKRMRAAAAGRPSACARHQLASDDDALHLVRAFADAEKRRVAVEPLDRKLLRVAVAAVDAHRLVRVLERRLRGEVLRHARLEVAALAAVVNARGILHQEARRLDARAHLAQLQLDRLVLADRFAEGVALTRILKRLVERGLGHADAARRDVDASQLQAADGLMEAAPFGADKIGRRHAIVVEQELRGVDALVAELLELAARAEARP